MSKIAIPYDIYNKEGDLIEIDFQDQEGQSVLVALWDENDAQTSENRIEFRKWAKGMVKRKGYEVHE